MQKIIVRCALGAVTGALLLAGCSGGAAIPTRSNALLPSSRFAAGAHTNAADSWMSPQAASEDLLYVSDSDGQVDVFSYPDGKQVGVLKGFSSPAGLCSDSKGDVYVVNTNLLNILEYKHGGKKVIATLNDFGHYPFGCSVDPKSKNVAVANYSDTLLGPGSVSIFDGGKGVPHSYQDTAFTEYFFCGYDDRGNLFVDGADSGSYHTLFAELANGSSTLTSITLNKTIGYPGAVQWDGKYVAVQDALSRIIYRFSIAGSTGTSMGSIHLKGDVDHLVTQFWVSGTTIVVPFGTQPRQAHSVGFWSYPGGGKASSTFHVPNATELVGATISLANK